MRRMRGFTLIELMIVVAIIAIIAAIAIPGLLRSRIGTNESSAIGSLRSLSTSQAQFQSQAMVDQDGDGTGEYAWLAELAGTAATRGTTTLQNASPFIGQALGVRDASGFTGKSGYMFRMFLPGSVGGSALTEPAGTGTAADAVNASAANNQEVRWACYGWPNARTQSGNRAFFVNQQAEVTQTANTGAGQLYSGGASAPVATAALDTTNGADPGNLDAPIGLSLASLTAGDGGQWTPAGN